MNLHTFLYQFFAMSFLLKAVFNVVLCRCVYGHVLEFEGYQHDARLGSVSSSQSFIKLLFP